jgi:predicted O-methyltransferase YrrM
MSGWFEFGQWLIHRVRARGPHGVHSPLIFRLITEVLTQRSAARRALESVESYRRVLLSDTTSLTIEDYGAGSRKGSSSSRRVCDVARNAASSPDQLVALWCLVHELKPAVILEFGTNLGLGTMAMVAASPQSQIITMEGSKALASKAKEAFQHHLYGQIDCRQGTFDILLPQLEEEGVRPSFVFLDGNHRKEPTLHYVDRLMRMCSDDAVIMLDDIWWSREMAEAWKEICGRSDVYLTADFFHFGLIWKGKRLRKEHFILQLP